MEKGTSCHGFVGNIPSTLHSSDLRAFFSQFIEGKGFECFHFRHRPEAEAKEDESAPGSAVNRTKKTCCIVRMLDDQMDELIRMYHGQNWVDKAGQLYSERAVISRIKISNNVVVNGEGSDDITVYQTKAEKKSNIRANTEFLVSDLTKLPELNPPPIMPNGNVGTPLSTFTELIRLCKFPPHLIKKLGLTFPRGRTKKYGNVPFNYGNDDDYDDDYNDDENHLDDVEQHNSQSVDDCNDSSSKNSASQTITDNDQCSSSSDQQKGQLKTRSSRTEHIQNKTQLRQTSGECMDDCNDSSQYSSSKNIASQNRTDDDQCSSSGHHQNKDQLPSQSQRTHNKMQSGQRSVEFRNGISDSDHESDQSSDGELEDWERHEALHNDVDSQARTKERLFEEKIELKWEKGGSGLVWHTDAAFWKQQEEADFDEETVDDWDIDMGIYEEEGGGDKDAKDLLQMRVEKQWRAGHDIDPNRVGGFERFTRGIGGSVMHRQGWREGHSLGSSQVGITEPIPADGQGPRSKRGLGYYGAKLDRRVKRSRVTRDVVISTVFDKPDERSAELYESQGPHTIKYRDSISFVPAASRKPTS